MADLPAGLTPAHAGLDRPWATIDPAITDILRPGLEGVIEDVIAAVSDQVPQYWRGADSRVQVVLREGVRVALERLLGLLGTDDEPLGPAAPVYEGIGAAEYRAGRPLQAVLAAYRVGALATWRGLSSISTAAGVDALTTARLAEACFAYIDEISAVSAAGYARAQSADAGRREAQRAEFVRAVVEGAAPGALQQLAGDVGWAVPAEVAIAVWGRDEQPEGLMCARFSDLTVAVLRRSDAGRLSRVEAFAPSLGSWVPLEHAGESFAHARALRQLRGPAAAGAAIADDYLPELILTGAAGLATALIAAELAPLDGLEPQRRDVAIDTLTSWLLNAGSRAAVARELYVHPQTVAYRMEGIRQLLGESLATPRGRWRLLLALQAEQLRRPSAP